MELTVRNALEVFYREYHLEKDGGVNDPAVELKLLKGLPLYLPNFKSRRKILLKHDIHHALTGYSAKMKGEVEVSSWELSTGCFRNWFAFAINIYGMIAGLFIHPAGIWRAWLRGKRSRNLYNVSYKDDELLEMNIRDLRRELGLAETPGSGNRVLWHFLSFAAMNAFGILFSMISMIVLPPALIYSIFITMRRSRRKDFSE